MSRALTAESDAYVERHGGERDEDGHWLVVRSERAPVRKVRLGSGTVEVRALRVNHFRRG